MQKLALPDCRQHINQSQQSLGPVSDVEQLEGDLLARKTFDKRRQVLHMLIEAAQL
jgi:hypothetical protein